MRVVCFAISSFLPLLLITPSVESIAENLTMVFVSKRQTFLKRKIDSFFNGALKTVNADKRLSFHGRYQLFYHYEEWNEYSPRDVFNTLCERILKSKAAILFYLSEIDSLEYKPASAEYLLQIANFIGLPVIVMAEDNSGIVQPNAESTILQLSPSTCQQAEAMLSLLKRYNWQKFVVVTGSISGHEFFISSIRRLAKQPEQSSNGFDIVAVIPILWTENDAHLADQLNKLKKSEGRVILLYASQREADRILAAAKNWDQTGKDFVWILCKTAIGDKNSIVPSSFYPGLLAVDFHKEIQSKSSGGSYDFYHRDKTIRLAVHTWAYGIDKYLQEDEQLANGNISLVPRGMSCEGNGVRRRWNEGLQLVRYVRNVSHQMDDDTVIAFNKDGTFKNVILKILNLDHGNKWQEIGEWSSQNGLQMGDITWPGGGPTPPKGQPAKYHLRVVTLQEKPYVVYSDPDPQLGTCPPQSELCRIAPLNITKQFSNATANSKLYQCCSGLSIDLLKMLSEKISFDFELFEVPDKKWGAYDKTNKEWIGLIRSILDGDADMIVTSLQITPERSRVIDFSVPFLETGITIIVAVRDGVISPTAFLEPYDYPSWCLILLFSVHASGAAIFLVEWMSPNGLDRGEKPLREHKFSLFRSFWLIWSMLFGAAVRVDNPRGVSSRFLANIWALFAVVFTASYTANLAAFMITKEDYDRLTGIEDKRLMNPYSHKPPFKYATVPHGSTETNLMNYYPEMYDYMKSYNKLTAIEGVRAVKDGDINAFIYDATVLEYQASHDDGCKLRTVGKWHAMTGYGIGFPKGSKWISVINPYILKFQHDGELERLHKFWLSGSCKKNEAKGESSKPLGILNFTSAFILLACGMILGGLLMMLEHIYFKFFRAKLRKWDRYGCCSLVSLSLGKSLTFSQSVKEAIEMQKHFKCKNPTCETMVWRLKHELDMASLNIARLQHHIAETSDVNTSPLDSKFASGAMVPSSSSAGIHSKRSEHLLQVRKEDHQLNKSTSGNLRTNHALLMMPSSRSYVDDHTNLMIFENECEDRDSVARSFAPAMHRNNVKQSSVLPDKNGDRDRICDVRNRAKDGKLPSAIDLTEYQISGSVSASTKRHAKTGPYRILSRSLPGTPLKKPNTSGITSRDSLLTSHRPSRDNRSSAHGTRRLSSRKASSLSNSVEMVSKKSYHTAGPTANRKIRESVIDFRRFSTSVVEMETTL